MRLAAEADALLSRHDALVIPTTACVAPLLSSDRESREPLTRFTRPFNAMGQPAITLPLPVDGLPVGLQLIARRGEDGCLAEIAARVARALAEGRTLGDA